MNKYKINHVSLDKQEFLNKSDEVNQFAPKRRDIASFTPNLNKHNVIVLIKTKNTEFIFPLALLKPVLKYYFVIFAPFERMLT